MAFSNTSIKPALTAELVASAAEFFNLGSVDSYKEFDSSINLNTYMKCARGDFVLRVYHQYMTKERISFLQMLKCEVRKSGIPTPEPIGWAHSSDLGLALDRIVELEQFIPHQPVSYSWAHHEAAFPILGNLHDSLKQIVNEHNFVPTGTHNYAPPSQLLAWLNTTEAKIRASDNSDSQYALRVCAKARDFLSMIDNWWSEQGRHLPRQAVHGDFNTGTCAITSNDQTRVILDFDFVDIHERVFDIAYSMYFAIGSLEWGKPMGERDWSRITRSVELYSSTSEYPLTQEEWEALPMEIARVPLYWICGAGFAADPVATFLEEANSLDCHLWLAERLHSLLPLPKTN